MLTKQINSVQKLQESNTEEVLDLGQMEMPEDKEERGEETGDEPHGERSLSTVVHVKTTADVRFWQFTLFLNILGEDTSP